MIKRIARIPLEMSRLGDSLRELRSQRGMSLRAAARGCGVTPSYLAKLEAGTTFQTIGLAAFLRLAKFYDIPVTILLREAGLLEEAVDELPDFESYLRRKFQLSSAAIHDLALAKEIVDKKYPSRLSRRLDR